MEAQRESDKWEGQQSEHTCPEPAASDRGGAQQEAVHLAHFQHRQRPDCGHEARAVHACHLIAWQLVQWRYNSAQLRGGQAPVSAAVRNVSDRARFKPPMRCRGGHDMAADLRVHAAR